MTILKCNQKFKKKKKTFEILESLVAATYSSENYHG